MADPAPTPSAAAALRPLRILHAAMIATVFIYGFILLTVTGTPGNPVATAGAAPAAATPLPPSPILSVAMAAMSAVMVVALLIFRARKLPRRGREELFADGRRQSGGSLSRAEYFVVCVVSWALAESIAVYGLVLGFLYRELLPFLPFAAASLLLLLLLAPRRSHVAGSDAAG